MIRMLAAALSLALVLAGVGGCSNAPRPDENASGSTLSESQRDSVLARSNVPGASAVGRAFDAAGKEAAHAGQMDSLSH